MRFPHFSFSRTDASPKLGHRHTLTSRAPPLRLNTHSTIEYLVPLVLLGTPHPLMRSHFPNTTWRLYILVSAETRIRDVGIGAAAFSGSFFRTHTVGDITLVYMGDDHLPFLHRGVSVLAEPFPRVWHTLGASINVHRIHVLSFSSHGLLR